MNSQADNNYSDAAPILLGAPTLNHTRKLKRYL